MTITLLVLLFGMISGGAVSADPNPKPTFSTAPVPTAIATSAIDTTALGPLTPPQSAIKVAPPCVPDNDPDRTPNLATSANPWKALLPLCSVYFAGPTKYSDPINTADKSTQDKYKTMFVYQYILFFAQRIVCMYYGTPVTVFNATTVADSVIDPTPAQCAQSAPLSLAIPNPVCNLEEGEGWVDKRDYSDSPSTAAPPANYPDDQYSNIFASGISPPPMSWAGMAAADVNASNAPCSQVPQDVDGGYFKICMNTVNHLGRSCGDPTDSTGIWEEALVGGMMVQVMKYYRYKVGKEIMDTNSLTLTSSVCQSDANAYNDALNGTSKTDKKGLLPFTAQLYSTLQPGDLTLLKSGAKLCDPKQPDNANMGSCGVNAVVAALQVKFAYLAECEVASRLSYFEANFLNNEMQYINKAASDCAAYGSQVGHNNSSAPQGKGAGYSCFGEQYEALIRDVSVQGTDSLLFHYNKLLPIEGATAAAGPAQSPLPKPTGTVTSIPAGLVKSFSYDGHSQDLTAGGKGCEGKGADCYTSAAGGVFILTIDTSGNLTATQDDGNGHFSTYTAEH